jgi:hypothetical protein
MLLMGLELSEIQPSSGLRGWDLYRQVSVAKAKKFLEA